MLVGHLLCIFLVLPIFSILVVKDAKTANKVILTSVRHAEHLFAGQKTQHQCFQKFSILIKKPTLTQLQVRVVLQLIQFYKVILYILSFVGS